MKTLKQVQNAAATYRNGIYQNHKNRLLSLKSGQAPKILFVCCSDSRVLPGLFTQSAPEDLFEIQNAGNIIPAYEDDSIGYAATLEYAVRILGVEHIIICGHESCGAMGALLNLDTLTPFVQIQNWLKHAPNPKNIVSYKTPEETLERLVQQNTLHQLDNIKTYPWVAEKIEAGELQLHAWVHHFSSGDTYHYVKEEDAFLLITPEEN